MLVCKTHRRDNPPHLINKVSSGVGEKLGVTLFLLTTTLEKQVSKKRLGKNDYFIARTSQKNQNMIVFLYIIINIMVL